jgi:hypothetical protein
MTPKEKAFTIRTFYLPYLLLGKLSEEECRDCLLYLCDQVLNSVLPACEFDGEINENTIEYWQEVKRKIIHYD